MTVQLEIEFEFESMAKPEAELEGQFLPLSVLKHGEHVAADPKELAAVVFAVVQRTNLVFRDVQKTEQFKNLMLTVARLGQTIKRIDETLAKSGLLRILATQTRLHAAPNGMIARELELAGRPLPDPVSH